MNRPTTALVVSTYRWPAALAAVLRSVATQELPPDEIVIADDGSGEETAEVIERHRPALPAPLTHVWHPDDGFRLAQIRNKAVVRVTADYVLQLDGDMVLHPAFVRDHAAAARRGWFVGGSRVMMGPDASGVVLRGGPAPGPFASGLRNRENALHCPRLGRALARLRPVRSLRSVRGGNLAFWRDDFLAVNGYDERFQGWGREDTDLVVRFARLGLRRRFFKGQGIAFHLHHREASRDQLSANEALLRETQLHANVRCEQGVAQYLPDGASPSRAAG